MDAARGCAYVGKSSLAGSIEDVQDPGALVLPPYLGVTPSVELAAITNVA